LGGKEGTDLEDHNRPQIVPVLTGKPHNSIIGGILRRA
jgi:hypothetical protein